MHFNIREIGQINQEQTTKTKEDLEKDNYGGGGEATGFRPATEHRCLVASGPPHSVRSTDRMRTNFAARVNI